MHVTAVTTTAKAVAPHVGRAALRAGSAVAATGVAIKANQAAKTGLTKSVEHLQNAKEEWQTTPQEEIWEDVAVSLAEEA